MQLKVKPPVRPVEGMCSTGGVSEVGSLELRGSISQSASLLRLCPLLGNQFTAHSSFWAGSS